MEIAGVRVTPQTAAVLKALLDDRGDGLYGLEVARAVQLPTGSIYPILVRLEQANWIKGTWESPEQVHQEGRRRRRRYYTLTVHGRRAAQHALQVVEVTWVVLPRIQPGGAAR